MWSHAANELLRGQQRVHKADGGPPALELVNTFVLAPTPRSRARIALGLKINSRLPRAQQVEPELGRMWSQAANELSRDQQKVGKDDGGPPTPAMVNTFVLAPTPEDEHEMLLA